jgi:DHA1 family tetracycline resistance protein-like MFS transporter
MPDEKLDFQKILPVFVIVLIDLLGLTIILPLLPHYSVSFGASPRVYGLLAAAYPVCQFIAAPVLGRLSDRYGRKPVLLISQFGTFIGFLMLGFAGGLPLLFAARIIDGLSGGNISTAQAVITDSTTEKTRTQGLGLIGAAFGLGFTIGPVIAFISLRLSDNNYAVPAFVAAAMSLISIVLTAVWLKETAPAKTGGARHPSKMSAFSIRAMILALGHPAVGVLLGLIFFQQLARGSLENMIGLFTLSRLGMSGGDNAALFVFLGVIIVAVQGYFIGKWSRALGDRKLIYLGLGLLGLGLLLAAATPRVPVPWYEEAELQDLLSSDDDSFRTHEPPQAQGLEIALPPGERTGWLGLGWLMVALVPAAVGGGILYPSLNSLITKRVEPHEIGGMLGVSAALFSAGNALAPVVGGALFDWLGSSAPFAAGGLLIIVMLFAALRAITPGREEAVQPGLAQGGAH